MLARTLICCLIALCILAGLHPFAESESSGKEQPKASGDSAIALSVVDKVVVQSEPSSAFADPLRCDADGNLYVQGFSATLGFAAPIKKIDSKGNVKASFAVESIPNFQAKVVPYFAVGTEGDVYELVLAANDPNLYVVTSGKDAAFKSRVKLDAKISGSHLAVFPSGNCS